MKIRLNKAHFPVRGLGPGRRIGVWFQGCSIRCNGCTSLDTWGARPETAVDVDDIVAWCKAQIAAGAEGVTISGGEPFDQPEGLKHILEQLRGGTSITAPDILCFTGRHYSTVEAYYGEILALLDAIISGPFERTLPTDKYLCGSANQELRVLSEKGREKYTPSGGVPHSRKHIDVCFSQESLYLSGIPRNGDLTKLRIAMEARGVKVGKMSWRD